MQWRRLCARQKHPPIKEIDMETREDMLEKLLARAGNDEDFRGRLVANPRSALKEAFDVEIPDDFNILVHEDDARTAHLVLPASAALTDAQLQQAAGGSDDWCAWWY